MPGFHLQVAVIPGTHLCPATGIVVAGYHYLVSTAAQSLAMFEHWFQFGPIKLPLNEAFRLGDLRSYAQSSAVPIPEHVYRANDLYAAMVIWRGCTGIQGIELLYYMASYGGHVDCYVHRLGMMPDRYVHGKVLDIASPHDWYRARCYEGWHPVIQPGWHEKVRSRM